MGFLLWDRTSDLLGSVATGRITEGLSPFALTQPSRAEFNAKRGSSILILEIIDVSAARTWHNDLRIGAARQRHTYFKGSPMATP
jgi:hypothetical protein